MAVNASLVARDFKDRDPIGQRLWSGETPNEIVGVGHHRVGDVTPAQRVGLDDEQVAQQRPVEGAQRPVVGGMAEPLSESARVLKW